MDSRRDFLRKAALLSGGAGLFSVLPPSIQKALAIDPEPGTTFHDAEHVVFLMQENRSFDHCFGSLQGVRGFNDPRAITLPNKNKVWLQSNAAGKTYAPFRLNIKETKATWMGALPHSWNDQTAARNKGKFDKWLDSKSPKLPMTLGYYTRADIPFYYDLADAFTICDQNFCSSLTGTTPNRLFFWTGTIREEQNGTSHANTVNSDVDYGKPANWNTFPEQLEDHGISWKIYQNEISAAGLEDEHDAWLANFTDNPIEWFTKYNVGFSAGRRKYRKEKMAQLTVHVAAIGGSGTETPELKKELSEKNALLKKLQEEEIKYSAEKYAQLTQREKNLHEKAFCTNSNDPFYRQLSPLKYIENGKEETVNIPKGDVLHQFRADVKGGTLPTVSWIVAPEKFSDHPTSPWYGAWYLSEVMDILTQNPEVWKKTIFVLAYDENDGYFDHIPPFVAPNPKDTSTGKVSAGIDTAVDYESNSQSPIGLGYRVPLIIASPWSRGGWVNSQVFDHTSSLQFLEKFLQKKTGKPITCTNISNWRRTVCGDLSSVFRPYNGEKTKFPNPLHKEAFIESIDKARFKGLPSNFKALTTEEIALINKTPLASPYMPKQEKGIRPSSALPYQLHADGRLDKGKGVFKIDLAVENELFGKASAGSAFNVYAPGKYQNEQVKTWAYAVKAGDTLNDSWPLNAFEDQRYHLCLYGPNGFYREFKGDSVAPDITVHCTYERSRLPGKKLTGNLEVKLENHSPQSQTIEIIHHAYKGVPQKVVLPAQTIKNRTSVIVKLKESFGWYDLSIKIRGNEHFEHRYAGRVETGTSSFTDPQIGGI